MKKVFGVMVAMALLAGCSDRSALSKVEEEGNAPDETATVTEQTPGTSQSALTTVDLRMRAMGAESYSQLLVVPNKVQVFADGVELNVSPTWREVHLENMAHAEKLASFAMPEGAQKIHFRVEFGAAGGFATADTAGWIDSRRSVVEFDANAAELSRTKLAVVLMDAARSFVKTEETTRVLVPNFRVD
jgi:hypothetical protein